MLRLLIALLASAGTSCGSGMLSGSTATVPTEPCSGAYTDETFGINFAPPSGLSGPSVTDQGGSLRIVMWQPVIPVGQPIAAAVSYPIVPLAVELDAAVEAAIEAQRTTLTDQLGHTLLTDEAVTLDSGNEAHVLTGASDDGLVASVFVIAVGSDRFAIAFLVGSADAVEAMLVSGLSLCVE